MKSQRYTAVANSYARFNNKLLEGNSYIVEPTDYGTVLVHDYNGNYVGECRPDEFDNYRATKYSN